MNDPFLPKTRIAPQFGGPGTGLVIPPETPETSFSNFRISDWWQTTSANAAATLLSRVFAEDVDAPVPWKNPKEFAKFAADVPPQAWGELYNAPDKYTAEFLRAEFIKTQQAKERIASSGFGGEMLASGLSFVDPVNVVALAVPLGGAANTMRFMTRAGRLSWLAGQSLLGGSVNVAAESLRATYDPTFDRSALATAFASGAAAGITGPLGTNLSRGGRFALTGGGQFAAVGGVGIASGQSVGDAASAAAMAMIVGGSLAALPPTVRSQIEARLSEVPLVAAGDDARAAGLPLTPEGEQRTAFKPGKVEPEVVATQEAATPVPPPATPGEQLNLFDAYGDSTPRPPSDGPAVAVGATTPGQTTSTVDRAVEPGDFVATEMRAAAPARPLNAPRWDFAYQVGSSLVEDVRELGTMLFSDSLVRADGTVNMSSAADSWVRQNVQKREIAHARAMDEAFDGWAKDQMAAGRGRVDLMMRGRREFNQEVAKAARRQPGQYTQNPAINKAADAVRRELGELLNLQQRHLVDGMDKVGPNDNYVHRVYNLTRTMEAINRHGMDNVVRLFRDAMERHMTANRLQPGAFPPIDPKILDAAAAGMVERMVAGKLGFESVGGVVQMPSDMSGVLAQILRSKNVPEDTITATLARLVNQESEAGRIDSARSRVALDETTEIVTPAGRLSIEDILENDVDVLMTVYRRKALGASAMSEIFRSFRAKGYDEVFTFDGLLGRIRSEAQKKALQPGADMLAISRDLEANIDRLTVGYRHVMGEVLFPPSTKLRGRVDDVLALARQASYGIVMNVNGFAQIADTFKFLAPENLKALRKQIPAMGNIIDMARSGKMPSELIRELEYHTGVGADAIAERMINRFDDNAASNQLAGGRIESAMRAIGRVTSWIGFSRPINLFNQRTAALTAMQRIGDAIFDGNTPDEIFARMGIGDRNMADRIVNQIRTNGRARANNAIEHLGLDKWDDYEAYAAWQSAFDRMRREINQENDFGNNTLWMTTEVGRSIMQFRTFANVAYQKATLRGAQRFLNGEGWEQAGTMLVNSIGGLLGYVALTYVNSLGREDREEFLRERLSSNALATAMFARSQWSSLFPLAADTVGFHVWGQQPFAPARNSGLQGHILFGNPTLSLVAGASNAVRGAVAPSLSPEYSFSREDLQAIRSVTPFQNAVGLSYFWNTLREDLPARSLEPQR